MRLPLAIIETVSRGDGKGAGKGAAEEKTRAVLNSGELSEDQHFLALGFESEGYVPEEAKKLLHAWAKLHKEENDLTNGDMSLMLFKSTTELTFIPAKFLTKCILERAAYLGGEAGQHRRHHSRSTASPSLPAARVRCALGVAAAGCYPVQDE